VPLSCYSVSQEVGSSAETSVDLMNDALQKLMCHSVSQRVGISGGRFVVLMNHAGQKFLCHCYATLYPRN